MGQKEDPAVANHVSGQSNTPISKPPHVLPYDKVIQELQTDGDEGLSPQEAKARLEKYGRNEFGQAQSVQPLRIIGAQLANAMTLVSLSHHPAVVRPSQCSSHLRQSPRLGCDCCKNMPGGH